MNNEDNFSLIFIIILKFIIKYIKWSEDIND